MIDYEGEITFGAERGLYSVGLDCYAGYQVSTLVFYRYNGDNRVSFGRGG